MLEEQTKIVFLVHRRVLSSSQSSIKLVATNLMMRKSRAASYLEPPAIDCRGDEKKERARRGEKVRGRDEAKEGRTEEQMRGRKGTRGDKVSGEYAHDGEI